MADLRQFLDALGLGQHFALLSSNDIDLDILADLSDQDLAGLGLSLGHRRKLMAAAQRRAAAPPEAPAAEKPRESQAERRQVTVLFADMVGSTALSGRLDPEDWGRLVRQYQDACAGVIARFDGFLAKFMGDGVLAYFGYPQAHEDGAERAARAGLEIVAAVRRIGDGTLAARVGIATGLVVVGEIIGSGTAQEQTIVGDTPNLAARLQALAEPHGVLIAGITRRLLGELFDYAFLGEHAMKGIADPVGVWRVLRESETQSRFQAVREAGALVGRAQEIALLAERWRLARAGEGQVVLLAGEAGIGKSRLVEALVERIRDERHVRVRMQCSPYHRNTALYPVTRHFAEAAEFAPEDGIELRREKLRSTLSAASTMPERAFRILAGAIGLGLEGEEAAADMTAAQQKSELMAVLAERLLALATQAPVLLLLEDAHWIDPTTRELFDIIVDRIETSPVAVIVTHRPEFVPPWTGRPFVTALAFNRLSGHDCAAIVHNLAIHADLPADLVDEILRRSDGVPLYVEELTKAVLEAGMNRSAVPPTLQDSLMARLDRLGRAKDVAQVASVIGREFARPLLAAVAGVGEAELDAALARLVEAGLAFPRGNPAEGRYSFKHALVQEAAYESLLRARRQPLHAAIGRALEAGGGAAREPEIAAYHFARAGLDEDASRHWERAGDKAVAQSSYAEAVANYQAAIDSARQLASGEARNHRLLALLLKFGPAVIVAKGYGTDEFVSCYREAYALAQTVGDGPELFKAVWGLWMADAMRQRFDGAGARAEELIALSGRLNDEDLRLEAIHCRWSTALFRGEARLALALGTEGAAHYVAERHHKFTHEYGGHDPGVCAHAIRALSFSVMGIPGQMQVAAEQCLALAERLRHPHSLAHALSNAATAFTSLGDAPNCTPIADRLYALAERYNFAPGRMAGEFHAGWASCRLGDAAGLKRMEAAFARRSFQAPLEFYHCAVMAETFAAAGRKREAFDIVAKTLEHAATSEIGFFVPELWRLRGEVTLALSAADRAEAERCLEHAAAMAERQGARLLELRATTSLAQLWAETGRRDEARARLGPLYRTFTQGDEMRDVTTAARLLATLA
ncbi:MAG TPA: AAA family ATPase [Stellaceae bacterium]|nr:AAA family ATPase [Stellaceae bacterium]